MSVLQKTTLISFALLTTSCAATVTDDNLGHAGVHSASTLSCEQIAKSMNTLEQEAIVMVSAAPQADWRDDLATGFGHVVFWPALMLQTTKENKDEFTQLKHRHNTLSQESAARGCDPVRDVSFDRGDDVELF